MAVLLVIAFLIFIIDISSLSLNERIEGLLYVTESPEEIQMSEEINESFNEIASDITNAKEEDVLHTIDEIFSEGRER